MNFDFLQNLISTLQKRQEVGEYFIALLIKPSKIGAILFEKQRQKLLIRAVAEKETEKQTELLSDEEFIQLADVVISEIEESVPEGILVQKTIFGVPYHYVEEGKIKKEHLLQFKKLCEALELTPVGFIVDIEALIYFLQKKNGIATSAVFVELSKQHVYLYLVRAGAIVEVKSSEIITDYIHTVELLLSQVEQFEVLPSKIILLATDDSALKQQKFISHPWKKELPFLHVPTVVALEKGLENEALINGVAQQMGFDLPVLSTKLKEDEVELHNENVVDEKDAAESEEKVLSDSNFGFVKDKDVAVSEEEQSVLTHANVSELKSEPIIKEQGVEISNFNVKSNSSEDEEVEKENTTSAVSMKEKVLATITQLKNGITISLPKGVGNAKIVMVGVIVLAFVGLFVYTYYNFLLKAEVVLFVDKKILDKKQDIALSDKFSSDPEKATIALATIDVEEDVQVEKNATGKKETGEKAKGEVTIFNKTEDPKNFSKGTIVVGPNSLNFELANDVKIASTSAFSTNFSSAKASIVATAFGSEYNLPSQTNFSFKDFSTNQYIAKNESALSGGSKKTLTVVAKKDIDDAEVEALSKVKEKALSDLKSKSSSDATTLPLIISYEFSDKKLNKKEGDEAKSVQLTGKIKFTGGAYAVSDVQKYINYLAQKEIPSSYSLQKDTLQIALQDAKIDDDKTVKAVLGVHSEYLPQVDVAKIQKEVAGVSKSKAETVLSSVESVSSHTIILKNTLPFLPTFLPFTQKNIIVTVKPNA